MKKSNEFGYLPMISNIMAKPHARMALTVSCCLLVYPTAAHAYIDPGSGSVVMSTLLGLVAAAAYTFKKYFYKIKRLVRKGDPAQVERAQDGADKE